MLKDVWVCKNCHRVFTNAYGKTECPSFPGGGGCDKVWEGGREYGLHGPGAHDGQTGWTVCTKCKGVYFTGNHRPGVCPLGGGHKQTSGLDLALLSENMNRNFKGVRHFRWCKNCEALYQWFAGQQQQGECAAFPGGGGHDHGELSQPFVLAEANELDAPATLVKRVPLRITTFNTGLLDTPVSDNEDAAGLDDDERARRMAARILASGADIVALNEVFVEEGRRELIARLGPVYPYAVYEIHDDDPLNQDSGLMLFSKYPFEVLPRPGDAYYPSSLRGKRGTTNLTQAYVGFFEWNTDTNVDAIESLHKILSDAAADKGVGVVLVRAPEPFGLLPIAFAHMWASYADDTPWGFSLKTMIRNRQLGRIRRVLESVVGPELATRAIILGDLNVVGNWRGDKTHRLTWTLLEMIGDTPGQLRAGQIGDLAQFVAALPAKTQALLSGDSALKPVLWDVANAAAFAVAPVLLTPPLGVPLTPSQEKQQQEYELWWSSKVSAAMSRDWAPNTTEQERVATFYKFGPAIKSATDVMALRQQCCEWERNILGPPIGEIADDGWATLYRGVAEREDLGMTDVSVKSDLTESGERLDYILVPKPGATRWSVQHMTRAYNLLDGSAGFSTDWGPIGVSRLSDHLGVNAYLAIDGPCAQPGRAHVVAKLTEERVEYKFSIGPGGTLYWFRLDMSEESGIPTIALWLDAEPATWALFRSDNMSTPVRFDKMGREGARFVLRSGTYFLRTAAPFDLDTPYYGSLYVRKSTGTTQADALPLNPNTRYRRSLPANIPQGPRDESWFEISTEPPDSGEPQLIQVHLVPLAPSSPLAVDFIWDLVDKDAASLSYTSSQSTDGVHTLALEFDAARHRDPADGKARIFFVVRRTELAAAGFRVLWTTNLRVLGGIRNRELSLQCVQETGSEMGWDEIRLQVQSVGKNVTVLTNGADGWAPVGSFDEDPSWPRGIDVSAVKAGGAPVFRFVDKLVLSLHETNVDDEDLWTDSTADTWFPGVVIDAATILRDDELRHNYEAEFILDREDEDEGKYVLRGVVAVRSWDLDPP